MRRAARVLLALAALAALASCKPSPTPTPAATAPAGSGTTATTPVDATKIVAPTPPVDPAKLTFADGSDERKLENFCIGNYHKLDQCFKDESFWEILATIFFAQNPAMDDGTPRTRTMWIGMRKDDFASLIRDKRVPLDCQASIRHSRWPTSAAIERVMKARAGSCPAFANAFGTMLFVDGAFSQPR